MKEHDYFVYIMTNKLRTVLYIGVTNSLTRRVIEHREGRADSFTKKYNANRLVYFERFDLVEDAIAREKQLKGWRRTKKDALIETKNPTREDLGVSMLGLEALR